jgi:hypothetical protein
VPAGISAAVVSLAFAVGASQVNGRTDPPEHPRQPGPFAGECSAHARDAPFDPHHRYIRYGGRIKCKGAVSYMKLTIRVYESGHSQAVVQTQHSRGTVGGLRDAGILHCDSHHQSTRVQVTLNATDNFGNPGTVDAKSPRIGCNGARATGVTASCGYRHHFQRRVCSDYFDYRPRRRGPITYFFKATQTKGPDGTYQNTRISKPTR